jgi:hypothetical protein
MPYPPLIYLDEDTEDKLRLFLNNEITLHYMEKQQFIEQLTNWQRDYWASVQNKEDVEYPFKGGASIIIPLTAISFEAIHARTFTTMFALDEIVAVKAVSDEFVEHAEPVQDFLNKELLNGIDIRKNFESAIIELEKFGTGIAKSGYERIVKRGMKQVNGKWEEFEFVQRDGPTIESPSLGRFMMRFHEVDPQRALWCGEEHTLSPHDIKGLEDDGLFYEGSYDEIIGSLTLSQAGSMYVDRKILTTQEELEKRKPVLPQLFDVHEIYLSWNVDANMAGNKREIVVWYNRITQKFLAIRYNSYKDLRRPYRYGNYIPVEHRWTGIGICKQNESFQEEITTQHRQRLDNGTLANMRMFKVKRSLNYGPNEELFPGKIWEVEDSTDIESFQMGEVYQSSFANEQATLVYSQQRTGVNEVTLGQPQVGTPGTATDTLSRIQEGNRKHDYTYSNTRMFGDRIILDCVLNIQQFGPHNIEYYDYNKGGKMVKEFFNQDFTLIAKQTLLEIGLAGQKNNKLLDRQNWQTIAQLTQTYLQGMMQMAAPLNNPMLMGLLSTGGMLGATEVFKQILESFDLRNIDRAMPFADDLKKLVMGLQQQLMNPQPQIPNGGQPAIPSGNTQASGPIGQAPAAGASGEFTTLIPQPRITNIIRTNEGSP